MVYFDWNATQPIRQAALECMQEAYESLWYNPSSIYLAGARVRNRLEDARAEVAEILKVRPERVVFCSGATEANNAIIRESARIYDSSAQIYFSQIEHSSVRMSAERYFAKNSIQHLRTEADGTVFNQLNIAQNKRNSLVSVMAINNETGVIQPVRQLFEQARNAQVPFHCDASQLPGKASLEMLEGMDWLTLSGHKFGGPRGVGVLVVPDAPLSIAMLSGGGQESGIRGGTENVPAILGMVAAFKECLGESLGNPAGRDSFENLMEKAFGERFHVYGKDADRSWNCSYFSLPKYPASRWISILDQKGFQISKGSACSAGKDRVSPVLKEMGVDNLEAGRSLRVSSGKATTETHWVQLAEAFIDTFGSLEASQSASNSMVIDI